MRDFSPFAYKAMQLQAHSIRPLHGQLRGGAVDGGGVRALFRTSDVSGSVFPPGEGTHRLPHH